LAAGHNAPEGPVHPAYYTRLAMGTRDDRRRPSWQSDKGNKLN
jgi:hypothetical protein